MSRLAKLITLIDGRLPPAKIVSPTLEFLQGIGRASDNLIIRWILARCHRWCVAASLLSDSPLEETSQLNFNGAH